MSSTYRYFVSGFEGRLCVCCSFSDHSKPVLITNYWPTDWRTRDFIREYGAEYIGAEALSNGQPGSYSVRIGKGYQSYYVKLVLPQGGRTESIHVDQEPLPAPKTKVETRYINGGWQKYLKDSGWCVA